MVTPWCQKWTRIGECGVRCSGRLNDRSAARAWTRNRVAPRLLGGLELSQGGQEKLLSEIPPGPAFTTAHRIPGWRVKSSITEERRKGPARMPANGTACVATTAR